MAAGAAVDWEAIEREYRAGQLSMPEIARIHEIHPSTIKNRAKSKGWTRSLTNKVRAAIKDQLAREALVPRDVPAPGVPKKVGVDSLPVPATDEQVTQAAAARGVELVRQHRGTLARAQRVAASLLDRLEQATKTDLEDLERAVAQETEDDPNNSRRSQMMRAVQLPALASTARELSQVLKNLMPLERQAFNLDENSGGEEPATKADVRTSIDKLSQEQRDELRSIARSIAGGSKPPAEGTGPGGVRGKPPWLYPKIVGNS